MFRGGGTGCSALHGNQRKALSVELNLHSKSPYSADYHTWERERWGKKCSAHNFLTLAKGEKISYLRLPPWCTYFFMYPYEHMTAMECKEVCILGEVRVLVSGKKMVSEDVCALLIWLVWEEKSKAKWGERERERGEKRGSYISYTVSGQSHCSNIRCRELTAF